MLDLLKQELDSQGVFSNKIPQILEDLATAVPINTITHRMKLTFAVAELILFTSQFRRNILHWNNSLIPINAITFGLSKSGDGKDSGLNAIRKCFQTSYDKINAKRKELAHSQARAIAAREGLENPNDWNTYKEFYKEPQDLFLAPGTVEGFINHLNQLDEAGIGAGMLFSGEIGSQLMTSGTIIHNIEFLSEVYDEGKREAKIIRSKEKQTKAIKNLPVSAIFVGSQDNILFEHDVKKKFRTEFSTKLARRSFFNYNHEKVIQPTYPSIAAFLAAERKNEDKARLARVTLDAKFSDITDYQLAHLGMPITVSNEAMDLFLLYRRYNAEVANTIKRQYPISKIVRTHLQWKAFKLAGAFAVINKHETMTKQDYIDAITFVEMLDKDMMIFEQELTKDPYELFISYMHQIEEDGKAFCNIHILKKMGYIQGTANVATKMKELIQFASSADNSGIYTASDLGIQYERIIKTNASGVSYLKVSGSKEQRAKQCASGYTFGEFTFAALGQMLQGDFAYSPFNFKDGIRGKDRIISGCKWICFDIDKSSITDEECHRILANYNHHIVRTSDPTNPFKFRVLLELDSYVDVEDKLWKDFTASIANYLALTVDPLPKSQIFFSYSGRNVLSVTDKQPLEVRDHLLYAHGQSESKIEPTRLSNKEKQAQLADPLTTFSYAFEAEPGSRSLSLIRAAKHARDLGQSNDDIIALMHSINDYWQFPISQEELSRTIISQIQRWT
jgi:hypothetical protein